MDLAEPARMGYGRGSDDYRGKVMLAPMVRAGTLPMRLLALGYGADLVYSEEIIDYKCLVTKRLVNTEYNTIDFQGKDFRPVYVTGSSGHPTTNYRTCPREAGRNIVQIGSNNATRALTAALLFAGDVAGIDVNMGCPKHFSMHAGMGAALLNKVEVATDIVKTLRRNLPIPVTCKIRLLKTDKDTMDYMKAMEMAGAVAIGVHARHIRDRPAQPALWDKFDLLSSAVSVPLIANGDVFVPSDIDKVLAIPGVSSCMIARGAIQNCSLFRRKKGLYVHSARHNNGVGVVTLTSWAHLSLELNDVLKEYTRRVVDVGGSNKITKFTLQQMLRYNKLLRGPICESLSRAKDNAAFAAIYGLEDYKRDRSQTEAQGVVPVRGASNAPSDGHVTGAGAGAGAGAGSGSGAPEATRRKGEGLDASGAAAESLKRPRDVDPAGTSTGDAHERRTRRRTGPEPQGSDPDARGLGAASAPQSAAAAVAES